MLDELLLTILTIRNVQSIGMLARNQFLGPLKNANQIVLIFFVLNIGGWVGLKPN